MIGLSRVAPLQQPRDVLETDVAGLQFLVVQDAHAAVPGDLVAVEREVDLLDADAARRTRRTPLRRPGAPPLNRMLSDAFIVQS